MPFTPSHAIVALPFIRTPIPPAAVAIGAMAPDAPLFFRIGVDYWATHSFPGMLIVGLPVALLLLLVWYLVLRPSVIELVPDRLARLLPAEWSGTAASTSRRLWKSRSWLRALAVLVGLAIGIATHVVWDSFTHEGRWGSTVFPALAEHWGPLPGYDSVQHSSSALGLSVIFVWAILWLRKRRPSPVQRSSPTRLRAALWVSIPLCLLAAALAIAALFGSDQGAREFAFRAGTLGGAGILVCVVAAAVVAQLFARRENYQPAE